MPEKSFQGQSVSKSKPGASEEDGLPAIEKLQRMSSGGSKDQGIKKKASSSKSPAEHTDSDDSMPALESIKVETPAPPIASTSISAKKGSGPPPLEPITSSDEEEDSNNDSISENERPRTHPPPLDPMALSEDEMDLLFRVAIEDEFPEADEDMDDDSEGSYDETLDESDEEDEWETEDEDTAGEIENRWVPSEADWTVDPSTWSFPDGLPADCMLPLALVNRPFLYAARKILYTKGINVNSPWQLHLLVRTLASAQVSPFMDDPASTAASGTINSMVKHLSFHIACGTGPASLGRGGIGLVAEAIQHCPRATNVTIKSDPLRSAWPVLEKALRTARHLETISLRSGSDQTHPMLLSTDRLASLTQYWPDLKQINLLALARPTDLTLPLSASAIHRQLTTVSLTSPNITGKELGMMLAASVGQLHSFKLIDPSNEMTRGDLAEVLLTHAPYITEVGT